MGEQGRRFQSVLWGEVALAVCVLLWSVPVLLHKILSDRLTPFLMMDWFIVIVSVCALMYFIAGIAALDGLRLWRVYHIVALVMAGVFTIVFGWHVSRMFKGLQIYHVLPVMAAFSVTVVVLVMSRIDKTMLQRNQEIL